MNVSFYLQIFFFDSIFDFFLFFFSRKLENALSVKRWCSVARPNYRESPPLKQRGAVLPNCVVSPVSVTAVESP